jgi:two-component system cell cycle sensor histidine kinase/response regulator CckA
VSAPVAQGSELLLLVEDNDSVRSLARETLARAGYRVLEARNGQEALAVGGPRLQELSLLITDMVMPVMGGRELAKQIRHWRPDLKIIFTSGYIDERVTQPGVVDDSQLFLQKPFTPVALGRAVRDVLDGAQA